MINNHHHMDDTTPKKRQRKPQPEIASKSGRPGPKSHKSDQVVEMLRQPGGATLEEMAAEIGWKVTAITRIVQWLLFCTRAGIREVTTKKRPDGTTVYKAA